MKRYEFVITYDERYYSVSIGQMLQNVIEDKEVRDIVKKYPDSMESTLGRFVVDIDWTDYLLIKKKYPEYLI